MTVRLRGIRAMLLILLLVSDVVERALHAQEEETEFLLDFEGPGALAGSPGQEVEAVYFLTLTPSISQRSTCAWSVSLTATDAIFELGVLFLGQGPVPLPGMDNCGADPTLDSTGCLQTKSCP